MQFLCIFVQTKPEIQIMSMNLLLNPDLNKVPDLHSSHLMVVKDNRLMEARFSLKLWEMRIFERMISLIDYGDKEFRLCRLYIRDLLNFFTCTGHNNYEMIREAANSLADKKIQVRYKDENGKPRWAKLSIFPTVTMPDEAIRQGEPAYIELAFHQDLKPYLLDLKTRFKAYPIANIQALQSIYSIRLFILLKQYEGAKEHTFDLPFLRSLLGIEQNEYTNFNDFKRRVLMRPQKDLEKHCDICFDFQEMMEGRKVTAITFMVRKNKNVNHEQLSIQMSPKQHLSFLVTQNYKLLSPVWNLAAHWGISEKVFLQILQTTPFKQVQLCVDFVYHMLHEVKADIQNIPAYFYALIKLSIPTLEATKPKAARRSTKKLEGSTKATLDIKKTKAELEKQLIILKRELFSREDELMDKFYEDLSEDQRERFLFEVRLLPMSRFDQTMSSEENFRYNRVFRFNTKGLLMKVYPQIFNQNNIELRQEIAQLQKLYNSL